MSSQLYKEARTAFVRECNEKYREPKDLEMLRDFLSQRGSPEEAQQAAGTLKADAGKKYGSKKVGDTEIPGEWIDSLMSNIGNFVTVGNYAMQGAPESVGLAWFAVKLTLSAIQNNYALYTLFGSGLTDISEIMIMIPHYDRLYDERAKAKVEWKQSPVMDKLFKDIVNTYVAVLSFSFSVRRHLSAGSMAKLRHGFKDFFGVSEGKFRGKLDHIAVLKNKILEESQAIFQDRSLQHLEAVRGIVSNIEGTVNQIKGFQATLQKMQEEQATQWQIVLKKMEEIKATSKPITPWDQALHVFEKNKEALSPQKDTSDALVDAIDKRHLDTCQWIFEQPMYNDWKDSEESELLLLSGQQGSGKSVVLATVIEELGLSEDGKSTLLYFSCGASKKSSKSSGGALTVNDICHTLLYQLYGLARQDENNVQLLEDCNKVFANPKAKKIGKVISQSNQDEKLPDFVDAFLAIAERLKISVLVALDEVDILPPNDQQELATRLKAIVAPSETVNTGEVSIKVLAGCRSGTEFQAQLHSTEVDVGDFNKDDIIKKLSVDLKNVPGLTEDEQSEAIAAIIDKAGPRFTYVNDIAVPFMREPFQRPLSRRLQSLPEGMNNIYNEALRKMGSNYVDLLHTALKWTLLAPVPLKVDEIMDAYHGAYNDRGPEVESEARELEEKFFSKSPELKIEQLRSASGPFLRLEQVFSDSDPIVTLRDAPLVKEFCLHSKDTDLPEDHPEGEICARCKSAFTESKSLAISPKKAHLELALTCLRHLNNPIFQRRATANDAVPLWSQPKESEGAQTEENSVDEVAKGSETNAQNDAAQKVEQPASEEAGKEPESDSKPSAEENSAEGDAAEANADPEHAEDDDGNDSDDSMDDEDRGVVNLAKALATEDEEEEDSDSYVESRETRYELLYWSYHIREADALWTPEERAENSTWAELMTELDYFVSDSPSFFRWWQNREDTLSEFQGQLKPLHIAAFLGLTSWAQHLLSKGADPNEFSGVPNPHNPIQVAALRADSRPMLKLLLENGADPMGEGENTIPAFHEWLLKESSLETVQIMLKHGANPTVADKSNRWTALHYFSWAGSDVEALDLLLDTTVDGVKPDINKLDGEEYSPLHVLLWRREVPKPLLKAYIARGADVNRDNHYSARPLQMASMWGDLETLQILCEGQSVKEIDDDDVDGDSALSQAAIGSNAKCIKFLLELGANANIQNKLGRTPLHQSALEGAKDCVEVLIEHDAQLNLVDKHNRTPLLFACLSESLETASLLLDKLLEKKVPISDINKLTKRHRSPLRQAAGRGFDDIVDKLIKLAHAENDIESLHINEPDTRKGMTPLHRAAWFGQAGCVRLLLAENADITSRDHDGKSALVLAYEQWTLASHQSSFEDIISLLIAGAPKDAVADPELVAICAINGSTRLLQQLCALGADLNRQDRYGWTPLDLARQFQQESAGRFLKQQAAWAGLLPSRWTPDKRTNVAEDGKSISHTSDERICVSTDKPLPAGLDKFYFEITSKPLSDQPTGGTPKEWALGFCTIGGHAIDFPGWPWRSNAPSARSWGYHADDGGLYSSSAEGRSATGFEPTYSVGDTVGCGVDLTTGTVWYTRNGEKLESGFENVQGRLFPVLGLSDTVELETNFTGPFLWKEDEVKEQAP